MRGKKIRLALVVMALCLFAGSAMSATAPLVDLNAASLPEGPLTVWKNAGTLKGTFVNDGTNPVVKVVDSVKAVVFSGRDHMLADFIAPDSITGDKPFSAVVRTLCTDIRGEKAVVSWSTRPNNCLEIEYGDALNWGAIGTYSSAEMGWMNGAPATGKWHNLVYVYTGGKDGTMQAWADGELLAEHKATIATKPGKSFVLGACQEEAGPDKFGYTHAINGAIASVKAYDRALTIPEIWKASGMETAYPASPARGSLIETLKTDLKWLPGKQGVASYDVYMFTEKASVEAAAKTNKKLFRGTQKAPLTQYPAALELGKTYYWRVDQRDASGKVDRGVVASFTVEHGRATDPQPDDEGFFVEQSKAAELKWTPGKYAVKQNVYFGDSRAAVLAAKTPAYASLPGITTSVRMPEVDRSPGKTYYWRVESINRKGTPNTKGDVWSVRIVNKKLPIYLLGGQSNATGCSPCNDLPKELLGPQKNVIVFARGGIKVKEYNWGWLRDGLGDGYGDKGKGCFGPELTFGTTMSKAKPGQLIGIIKCAWGATNLGVQWRPPSAGGGTGPLYKGFVEAFHQGMAALDPAFEPVIAGMIWMQGESDTGDDLGGQYAKNLACLINDIRAEVKSPNMPFVAAQISKAPAWGPQAQTVRDAEANISKNVPNTASFPTDEYKLGDPWHYDTAGMVSLGERFANAMLQLEKKQ